MADGSLATPNGSPPSPAVGAGLPLDEALYRRASRGERATNDEEPFVFGAEPEEDIDPLSGQPRPTPERSSRRQSVENVLSGDTTDLDAIQQQREDERAQRLNARRQQSEQYRAQLQGPPQTQAAIAAQQPAPETNEFEERDFVNDQVSRWALAFGLTLIGLVVTITWFNIQWMVGELMSKGGNKYISPPSTRPLGISFLPNELAVTVIILTDILLLFAILLFCGIIALVAYYGSHPLEAAKLFGTQLMLK